MSDLKRILDKILLFILSITIVPLVWVYQRIENVTKRVSRALRIEPFYLIGLVLAVGCVIPSIGSMKAGTAEQLDIAIVALGSVYVIAVAAAIVRARYRATKEDRQ